MQTPQNDDSLTGRYDVITSKALEVIITVVLNYILNAVPFLNLPVFKQLTTLVVTKIIEIAAREPILWGAYLLIDSNMREKLRVYDVALEKFKLELSKPNQDTNNEALKRAHEEWVKQLASLIRMPKP